MPCLWKIKSSYILSIIFYCSAFLLISACNISPEGPEFSDTSESTDTAQPEPQPEPEPEPQPEPEPDPQPEPSIDLNVSETFTNPIGELADPSIVYHDGWYYYTGTGTGGRPTGISMRRARTLEGLKSAPLKTIYTNEVDEDSVEEEEPAEESDNLLPCCDLWGPELYRINNTWYLYFSAKTDENSIDQRMWVIENSSENPMEGTWIDRGRIYDTANDFWATNGTVMQQNDQLFYIYSGTERQEDLDKPQHIYITRMINPWTIQGSRVHLSSPSLPFETDGLVNEAPSILQRDGKVFLTYSGSGCWSPNYALGMLWMNEDDDPMNTDSWNKLEEPIFTKDESRYLYGTGHSSFFMSPDNSEVWMAYHATTNPNGICNDKRLAYAKKIEFDEEGFPALGIPAEMGKSYAAPSGEPAAVLSNELAEGTYEIKPVSSTNKVLGVASCSELEFFSTFAAIFPGTNVRQYEADEGPCQRWLIRETADGHYWIGSEVGGLAMEVQYCSTELGSNVSLWAPNGNDCQKWDIVPNEDGSYHITNVNSGHALDILYSADNNGANLQTYEYLSYPNQNFELRLLSTSYGE